jgi:hypothetical protein
MGTGSLIGGLIVAAFVGFILVLLRRHQLREKYAALWLIIGLGIMALVLFPQLLSWAARLVGIQVPANLLFAVTLLLLLGVCLHLAWEVSRSEDRIRRLSEEVALLRVRVQHLEPCPDDPDESEGPSQPEA